MKKILLLQVVLLLLILTTAAQPKRIGLNNESDQAISLKSTEVLAPFDVATKKARRFDLNPSLRKNDGVALGDTLVLALFPGKEYPSVVQSKETDVNGTTVILAKLTGFQFAYCCISISDKSVLVTVDIPECNEKYTTRFQPKKSTPYLVQLDETKLDVLKDGHVSNQSYDSIAQSHLPKELQHTFPNEKTTSPNKVALKSAQVTPTTDDSAQIDILVVYTPAAKQWADTYEGGINNTISQAMAKCNLVSENSKLGIRFNLVHSTEVDYTESGDPKINYLYSEGERTNTEIDLNNLADGNISNVHTIRDIVEADLVVLLTITNEVGGLGWVLVNREGSEEYGFSLLRVQQTSGLIMIHEIGHNLGAHHPKEQNTIPGPTVWSDWPENTWSAGWRWKEEDNNYYCTVMGYESGLYYSDGNPTTQVPYFSDPDISFQGNPTGHATEANNAHTIRETKQVVAAYREARPKNTPTVYTLNAHDKTTDSAVSGGCVTNEGTSPVTKRGVVYSTSRMPTLKDNFTVDSLGKDTFSSNLDGLELNKVYYFRAYATNSFGTTYGNQMSYMNLGGVSKDFITRWELPEGQDKLELILVRKGEVDYTWETIPKGQSGSGTFPRGEGIVEIPNLPAGKTIKVSIAPTNLQRFYNYYAYCPHPAVYGPDRENLVDVEQWGTTQWVSMDHAFEGCKKLNISATDLPDLNNVKKMSYMFEECPTLNGPTNINDWNTSSVNNMASIFYNSKVFNQNIGRWDVSKVSNMDNMFYGASIFNQDIGGWDVSNVSKMVCLFYEASFFNQNIGNWNVSKVSDMSFMFTRADSFNQDIGKWDVSKVSNMNSMFAGASAFNQDIGRWNVSNVMDMNRMFYGVSTFNHDISGWDVSNVKDMSCMFYGAKSFNQNIGSWNVSKVNDMSWMFAYEPSFNQNLNNWDVSSLKNTHGMFFQASIFNQDISRWNVENVTDMTAMFSGANNFNQNLNNWDVSQVVSMNAMFNTANVFNGDISKWDVSNVKDMCTMFSDARNFNQDIGNWNVSSVTDMSWMFYAVKDFNQDIGNWNVSNVIDMSSMFVTTENFNQDIGKWNVSKVKSMSEMFWISSKFNQNISSWDVSKVKDMSRMFLSASSFNQNIGNWNISSAPNLVSMLDNCGMDHQNYSSTLNGWSTNPNTPDSLTLGADGLKYDCTAVEGRAKLTSAKSWTIMGDQLISELSQPNQIAGETSVCQGQTAVTYTVPAIENATSYVWTLPNGAKGTSTTNNVVVDFGPEAVSGNITVKGINACGESIEKLLPVTVIPTPATPTISVTNNVLCSDVPEGNQWYCQDGKIENATTKEYMAKAAGNYYVVASNLGCTSAPSKAVTVTLVGRHDLSIDGDLKLYPNPVSNQLTLEVNGNRDKIDFEIINVLGQTIFKGSFVGKTTVETTNFAPGTYLIKTGTGKAQEFSKLVRN